MPYTYGVNSPLSFRQLFATLFLLFVGLLAATALQAWTGPTATAPGNNVDAPINVGTTDQVKNGGISMNSLAVFGSSYIQNKLGIGQASPVVALDVNGSIKLGNGGELCQVISAGALRYNSSTNAMEYCNGSAWGAVGGGGGGVPSGAVIAFNLSSCPSGWSEYAPAYGRFIRGIDKSGTGIDPDGVRAPGSTQADMVGPVTVGGVLVWAYGATLKQNNTGGSTPSSGSVSSGGVETRPKNVALLYCQKN